MLRFLVVLLVLLVGARNSESFPVEAIAKVEEDRSHQGPHFPKGTKILNREINPSEDFPMLDSGVDDELAEQTRVKRSTDGARDANSPTWNSFGYFMIQLISPLPAPEKWVKEVRTAWGDGVADFFYDL